MLLNKNSIRTSGASFILGLQKDKLKEAFYQKIKEVKF